MKSSLSSQEKRVLTELGKGHEWLRATLCTLARRGVAYRTSRPDSINMLLTALATSPLYKGGQFLFDLLEWEDFMLDGQPPPILPHVLDATSLDRFAKLLNQVKAHLDGATQMDVDFFRVEMGSLLLDDDALPSLEGGFYLYQDVVLGILASVLPLYSEPESTDGS